MAKAKKVAKVVITQEHLDALVLLAGYGASVLEVEPIGPVTKGALPLDVARDLVDFTADILGVLPDTESKTSKKLLARIHTAIDLYNNAPDVEDYVDPVANK